MVNDYNRSPQEVLEELHTSPLGLTAAEAAARLAAHGPNKLKEAGEALPAAPIPGAAEGSHAADADGRRRHQRRHQRPQR